MSFGPNLVFTPTTRCIIFLNEKKRDVCHYKQIIDMIDTNTLKRLLTDVSELTAMRMLVHMDALKPQITLTKAKQIYGRTSVSNWIDGAKIKKIRRGERTYLNRIELETLSKITKFEKS